METKKEMNDKQTISMLNIDSFILMIILAKLKRFVFTCIKQK